MMLVLILAQILIRLGSSQVVGNAGPGAHLSDTPSSPSVMQHPEGMLDVGDNTTITSFPGPKLAAAACDVGDAACFCNTTVGTGIYPEPSGCYGYYYCDEAKKSPSPAYVACSPGTLFNASCSCCRQASTVQCLPGPPASPLPMQQLSKAFSNEAPALPPPLVTVPSPPQPPRPAAPLHPACSSFLAASAPPGGWQQAWATFYTSYPCCCKEPLPEGCSMEECSDFSGCSYQGAFAAVNGQQTEEWVQGHAIAALYSVPGKAPQYSDLAGKSVYVRSPANPARALKVQVLDTCSDSDCDGCCTANANRGGGTLIDLEYYTAHCLYSGNVDENGSQAVEWQVLPDV